LKEPYLTEAITLIENLRSACPSTAIAAKYTRLLLDLRVESRRTPEFDEERLLTALDEGANTLDDLIEELQMDAEEVGQILERLIKKRSIRVGVQGGKTDMARGRRNVLYFREGNK